MSGKALAYRYTLILLIGVVACLLLALSWPRLKASLRYLPVDTASLTWTIQQRRMLKRIDRMSVDGNARLEVYGLAVEAIGDNPLLGFGYGTFADSFRLYRNDNLYANFDKAHNTYLENIFELGWPAAGLLLLCLAWLTLICVRGARDRGRDWVYPAAGVACAQSYTSRPG